MKRSLSLKCLVLLLAWPLVAQAQSPTAPAPLPASDRASIEAVIEDFLLRRPEVVRDALQAVEIKEQIRKAQQAQQALTEQATQLFRNPASPAIGNPHGDVTVVEFLDYRCPHCQRVSGTVLELLAADPQVRVVFKDYPILGSESLLAARAALAAHRQGKYLEYHKALMVLDAINDITLLETAQALGLDIQRFQTDRVSPEVSAIIDANYALAAALNIGGTPAFVVGRQVIPGAATLIGLKQAVQAARALPVGTLR